MWAGRIPAHTVNRFINHLLLIPQSRVAAIDAGDIGWTGWDVNANIQAAVHDQLVGIIAAFAKVVDVESLYFPRPGDGVRGAPAEDAVPEPAFATLAEFNDQAFYEFMYGG